MTNAILVDEPSRYDIILPPPLTGVVPRNRYIATMMAMATIIVCDVVCEFFVGGQAFGGLIPPLFVSSFLICVIGHTCSDRSGRA